MESTNSDKASEQKLKSPRQPLPLPVQRALQKLGNDLALARRRRHMTQASVAERIGASRPTIQRMEQGDPRVPIHFIARAMYVFGEIDAINKLMDTARDDIGLTLMDEQLPRRVRNRKKGSPPSGAL
jgi:transcriptional regulator with XRE-family HTH domain